MKYNKFKRVYILVNGTKFTRQRPKTNRTRWLLNIKRHNGIIFMQKHFQQARVARVEA